MTEPQPKQNPRHKFSDYFYNRISYLGALLAFLVFVLECFLFGIDVFSPDHNLYLGMVTYLLLPPFLILGLILIPVGAWRKRRRVQRGLAESRPKSFYIDPSLSTHRNAIFVFLTGTSILIIMSMVGAYKAYHYTESVKFCGTLCHDLMIPQYTAYQNSPHARVKCVECHIGPGADWYVRSKLSGVRQVFRTIDKNYPRPIPTPVHNLRPAKETCEQCHWPGKFYSSFEMRKTYYPSSGETDKDWRLRMLIHVGRDQKQDYGIHAHMYVDNQIYYAADDERRQVISWIKSVDKEGRETIFTSPDSKYKETPPPAEAIRKMDCMDCHNRPSHHFLAPFELLNRALSDGRIDPGIPAIKEKAMGALSQEYPTQAAALEAIKKDLLEYYQEEHPDYYVAHPQKIEQAALEVARMFQDNFFPEMKTRWDSSPENIGHLISPGCFRCHDGQHQSSQGKTITRDCKSCHDIIEQGYSSQLERSVDGLEFRHPFDEDESWKDMNCYECHTGN